GGAHVRYLTLGTWPVNLLATWTRDRQVMSLEKAHYKISGLPAWIAGFTDRGILREGFAADIIVYEQAKLGFQYGQPGVCHRLPGRGASPDPEGQGHSLHDRQRGITRANAPMRRPASSCAATTW